MDRSYRPRPETEVPHPLATGRERASCVSDCRHRENPAYPCQCVRRTPPGPGSGSHVEAMTLLDQRVHPNSNGRLKMRIVAEHGWEMNDKVAGEVPCHMLGARKVECCGLSGDGGCRREPEPASHPESRPKAANPVLPDACCGSNTPGVGLIPPDPGTIQQPWRNPSVQGTSPFRI